MVTVRLFNLAARVVVATFSPVATDPANAGTSGPISSVDTARRIVRTPRALRRKACGFVPVRAGGAKTPWRHAPYAPRGIDSAATAVGPGALGTGVIYIL